MIRVARRRIAILGEKRECEKYNIGKVCELEVCSPRCPYHEKGVREGRIPVEDAWAV